jgi:hypothetical protein
MNDKMFPRRFTEALRPGAYLLKLDRLR